MEKPIIYADRIFYYESVLNDHAKILELVETTDSTLTSDDAILPWKEWVASKEKETDEDYIFGYQKQTDDSKLKSSSEDVKYIYESLMSALLETGKHYATSLGVELVPPSPLSISKYIQGASMGPHVDYHGEPDIAPLMSGVIYLNDSAVGGELYFKNQNVKIKPKAGSIVIFPSVEPYYHESLPIESGVKYMSPVFWIKRFNNNNNNNNN